jgi:hypothetical protein
MSEMGAAEEEMEEEEEEGAGWRLRTLENVPEFGISYFIKSTLSSSVRSDERVSKSRVVKKARQRK